MDVITCITCWSLLLRCHYKQQVQGLCTCMYFLVPFFSGLPDFWVLTWTAMYRLVSTRVQGSMTVNQYGGNRVHAGMYQYVLAYTSMYSTMNSDFCVGNM